MHFTKMNDSYTRKKDFAMICQTFSAAFKIILLFFWYLNHCGEFDNNLSAVNFLCVDNGNAGGKCCYNEDNLK